MSSLSRGPAVLWVISLIRFRTCGSLVSWAVGLRCHQYCRLSTLSTVGPIDCSLAHAPCTDYSNLQHRLCGSTIRHAGMTTGTANIMHLVTQFTFDLSPLTFNSRQPGCNIINVGEVDAKTVKSNLFIDKCINVSSFQSC